MMKSDDTGTLSRIIKDQTTSDPDTAIIIVHSDRELERLTSDGYGITMAHDHTFASLDRCPGPDEVRKLLQSIPIVTDTPKRPTPRPELPPAEPLRERKKRLARLRGK